MPRHSTHGFSWPDRFAAQFRNAVVWYSGRITFLRKLFAVRLGEGGAACEFGRSAAGGVGFWRGAVRMFFVLGAFAEEPEDDA
jgi:hypothetical protein